MSQVTAIEWCDGSGVQRGDLCADALALGADLVGEAVPGATASVDREREYQRRLLVLDLQQRRERLAEQLRASAGDLRAPLRQVMGVTPEGRAVVELHGVKGCA
jgi:hypothetical protein